MKKKRSFLIPKTKNDSDTNHTLSSNGAGSYNIPLNNRPSERESRRETHRP